MYKFLFGKSSEGNIIYSCPNVNLQELNFILMLAIGPLLNCLCKIRVMEIVSLPHVNHPTVHMW